MARKMDDEIIFDLSITCKDSVAECFRIFTDPDHISTIPAGCPFEWGLNLNPHRIEAYTDRACWNNGKEDARCGSRIWFSPEHQRNTTFRVLGPSQSNQVSKIVAVIEAVSTVPTFYPLKINTDSCYVIDRLTKHLKNWEDNGWIGVDNAKFFK